MILLRAAAIIRRRLGALVAVSVLVPVGVVLLPCLLGVPVLITRSACS